MSLGYLLVESQISLDLTLNAPTTTIMTSSVDPDQTAPIGAVCSGSTLFASILNLSVVLGNYLQQTTSADDI